MPSLSTALLATVLLSTALVAAAPTVADKSIRKATAAAGLTSHGKSAPEGAKKLRRGKRQVLVQEIPDDDEEEEELIRQQLDELSDDQIAILADIVQTELDKYVENSQPQQYEIIEIPDEILAGPLRPRDRRSVPYVEQLDDDEDMEEPELVVVPEAVIEEALQEQEDDLELRMRIAEMAQILNERATRRRYI